MAALELDDAVYEQVKRQCSRGDALAEEKKYGEAIKAYREAWNLIPEPKRDWNASTWIMAAFADAYFLAGHLKAARETLEFAMTCPGALESAFLHLRLGEVLFEAGELDRAADELLRAYLVDDTDQIFDDEDPKYLAFLKTRAILTDEEPPTPGGKA